MGIERWDERAGGPLSKAVAFRKPAIGPVAS